MAREPKAPWLHGETARRMGERLEIIRLQPELILDWWGFLGAGAEVLDSAYPKARRIIVEPDADLLARSRTAADRPWWSARKWSRPPIAVTLVDGAIPGGARLVWANMMLHMVADPPALFGRWEQLLGIDGFVMFSCLGPGTLRELRELYARLGWPPPASAFIDMHDLGDMLVHAGFADPVMDQETLTLRWDNPGEGCARRAGGHGSRANSKVCAQQTEGSDSASRSRTVTRSSRHRGSPPMLRRPFRSTICVRWCDRRSHGGPSAEAAASRSASGLLGVR